MASLPATTPVPLVGSQQLDFFGRTMREWGAANARRFPWRDTQDPYLVLVGEVLLQRTRGEHVVDVYEEFLRRWPTPQRLARARPSTLAKVIAPLGLTKRAPLLSRLGKELARRAEVPTNPAELLELPAVGPYAAHAVPIFACGRDLPLADWVIARVLTRYFDLPRGRRPNTDEGLWTLGKVLVEAGRARELWLAVLDFGAGVCKPRPLCSECPLAASCASANRSKSS